jgi:peptide/nickel transport system ATP-binding protein
MQDLLSVRDLAISLQLPEGKVEAVKCANFRVKPGSCVALVGESGAGKSICAQAILGILPDAASIDKGQILFSDPAQPGTTTDIAALDPKRKAMRRIRGDRISMIFQEPMTSLSPLHTVGNQIIETLRLHQQCSRTEALGRTRDMLYRVGFPDPNRALHTYPFELSGGLRQRAMIAMALVCQPALLIADEPTTALDVTIQAQILKLLNDLKADLGMAVLIITHDLGVVANLAEEVVVMYQGEVMESGTRDAIFRDARHPYLKALFAAVPRFSLKENERLKPLREISRDDQLALPEAAEISRNGSGSHGEPLLRVRGLRRTFHLRRNGWLRNRADRAVVAVDNVSFTIRRGECLGLVGESGSGKSTLSKLIMRAVTPDQGDITYFDNGKEIDVLGLDAEALNKFRRKIQYIFQDPFSSLDPRMTVYDIVSEPLTIHRIGSDQDRRSIAGALMRLVGLDERSLRRYPHSFSGGQRQRIGIARALALKPDILICDEPVSALDVGIQAQILNLLKDLQDELDLTYLFVSHNLAVVHYIADRIAVMCRGRLVELAPRDQLFENPQHPYTKGLMAAVPDTDPDHRLDFNQLMDERASEPAAWPEPYRDDGVREISLQDLGNGHYVRAAATL